MIPLCAKGHLGCLHFLPTVNRALRARLSNCVAQDVGLFWAYAKECTAEPYGGFVFAVREFSPEKPEG